MSESGNLQLSVSDPHALESGAVLDVLQAGEDGLESGEAARRLASIGPNRLPEPEREGWVKRFFKHFNDTLIYVLLGAAALTASLGHWVDTGVILGVVVINALIGFIQEGKAAAALEGIRKMLSAHAHVRRDGEWKEIEAHELVPGDLVRLRSGDRVPADLRLLQVQDLRIEESALTGESLPADKDTNPVAPDAGVGDRHGMAYSGTLVAAGRGTGVVTGTGSTTELGRISRMIAEVENIATPLTRQMNAFGKRLSLAVLGLAVAMFGAGWLLHDFSIPELLTAAIGFSVAAIPEGLPAILTITLAIGVQQMARSKAITRKLNAVETLGSVTVICSDKTGTLTRNEMTVRHMLTRFADYEADGIGYAPQGRIHREGDEALLADNPDLLALVEALAVCNDSEIAEEEGQWRVVGESTEGALRTLGRKAGFEVAAYERLAAIPFESENKFMATLNRLPEGARRVFLKGAPDRLLDRCASEPGADGTTTPLDRAFWESRIDELGSQGLRVLAAAARPAGEDEDGLDMAAAAEQ